MSYLIYPNSLLLYMLNALVSGLVWGYTSRNKNSSSQHNCIPLLEPAFHIYCYVRSRQILTSSGVLRTRTKSAGPSAPGDLVHVFGQNTHRGVASFRKSLYPCFQFLIYIIHRYHSGAQMKRAQNSDKSFKSSFSVLCHMLQTSVIAGPLGALWLPIAHILHAPISAVQGCHLCTEFSWWVAWPQWWIDSAQLTCGHSRVRPTKAKMHDKNIKC